ncbi:Protein CBG23388 [Caenorhabditis briggsae]|uniref:Protein CBG23388 n=1 Tax=Caenorhabditis briggsae TaxID=6238 RepID=A8Y414_CAEBR|nr:Protein CBG23388 [Caenorhabditis briggsae]CAP39634.2 Protein CBG23388 [Caenorhabditis briggsae]
MGSVLNKETVAADKETAGNGIVADTSIVYKQWISFSSLSDEVQMYYRGRPANGSMDVSLVTNQIFQFVAVFTGFGGMYITDNKGIKTAGLLGTSLNVIGASIRMIASIPFIESHLVRETLLHAGSFIAASAQAFFLVLPSKIAECWFPGDQRAIANVLSFVANPAGVALGTIVPSVLFKNYTHGNPNSWMFFSFVRNYQMIFSQFIIFQTLGMEFLAFFPFILALFVRSKLPPTPPSASSAAHQNNIGFVKSILQCIMNLQFFIQMTLFAFAFSLLWSLMIFLDGPLKDQGYNMAGYPTAVCAVVGTMTSLLAGHIADKTRKFKEIIRVCTVGFSCSVIILRFFLNKPKTGPLDSIIVYILCGCLGAFSIPQFPIGVELGVETTFPVMEATSSGVLVIFGSLFMFIIPFVQTYTESLRLFYQQSWKFALDVTCALSLVSVVLSLFFLKPRYRRLELENAKLALEKEEPVVTARTVVSDIEMR